MKEYMNLSEIASMFHVSERHLYRMKAKGEFPPPIPIGRCHRWDPDEVRRFFEKGKNGQGPKRGR